MTPTELCLLAAKYGSDKCPQIKHNYTPFYYELLKDKREIVKKVLEMGVGYCHGGRAVGRQAWDRHIKRRYYRGASLLMWRDFFPKAMIYGGDRDQRAIFEDERIRTFLCDETKIDDLRRVVSNTGSDIDFFVDDASHLPDDQAKLAQDILPMLKKDVIYIIEDIDSPMVVTNYLQDYDCHCPIPGLMMVSNKC